MQRSPHSRVATILWFRSGVQIGSPAGWCGRSQAAFGRTRGWAAVGSARRRWRWRWRRRRRRRWRRDGLIGGARGGDRVWGTVGGLGVDRTPSESSLGDDTGPWALGVSGREGVGPPGSKSGCWRPSSSGAGSDAGSYCSCSGKAAAATALGAATENASTLAASAAWVLRAMRGCEASTPASRSQRHSGQSG